MDVVREVPSTPWLWSPSSPAVLGRGRSGAGGHSRWQRGEQQQEEREMEAVCKGLLLAAQTQLVVPRACTHSQPFTCTNCPLALSGAFTREAGSVLGWSLLGLARGYAPLVPR